LGKIEQGGSYIGLEHVVESSNNRRALSGADGENWEGEEDIVAANFVLAAREFVSVQKN